MNYGKRIQMGLLLCLYKASGSFEGIRRKNKIVVGERRKKRNWVRWKGRLGYWTPALGVPCPTKQEGP